MFYTSVWPYLRNGAREFGRLITFVCTLLNGAIFTARCCIRGILAMALCPSVCPSVRHKSGVLLKRLNVESHKQHHTIALFCSVLQPSSIRGLATPWTYFLHLSLSSVILIDSSTDSPVQCPRLDVVHPGRAWPSSPSCTWHCSLHYLFLQATPLFPHCVTIVC